MSPHQLTGVLKLSLVSLALAWTSVSASEKLLIEDVRVIDIETGEVSDPQDVLVSGAVIASIGDETRTDDIRVISGSDRFLIPGLWDAHVHSAYNRSWHFPLLLAHGVTSVRNMHTTSEDGLSDVNAIKRELADGKIIGPRFIANGNIVDGENARWPGTISVTDPRDVPDLVRRLKNGGADFIKIYDNLSFDVFETLLSESKKAGLPVDGHIPAIRPAEAALHGMRTVEHGIGIFLGCSRNNDENKKWAKKLDEEGWPPFPENMKIGFRMRKIAAEGDDPALCEKIIDLWLEHDVTMVPTLINSSKLPEIPGEAIIDSSGFDLLPVAVRDQWRSEESSPFVVDAAMIMAGLHQVRRRQFKQALDAGVRMLAGTDTGDLFYVPGLSLQQEIREMVNAGATPLQALQSATINPAKVFGFEKLGQVKEGWYADLVLLRANPLESVENISNIEAVVRGGRLLDRAALDALLAVAEQE